ncbi:MAG: transcriptional regulator [Pyrinomonadaceae bacterium]
METLKEQTFTFADFELDAAKRLLLKQGKAVSLNSKTFDLLLTLVENRGQVLSKEDLLNKVWTDQFVEENNLTVQISALRKIFGEKKGEHQFIVTVPGKGYKFVADVQTPQGEKEIVIESHKFSRVLIEEDIVEKSENEIAAEKIISPRRRLEEHERQKAVSKISPFIFYSSLGVILTVLLAGIWFSDNGKTVEKNSFQSPN